MEVDYLEMNDYLATYDEKMSFVEDLVRGLIDTNYVNSVMIVGPPGIGKTYTVNKILLAQSEDEDKPIVYKKTSGHITPLAFFNTLTAHSSPNSVLFFDDADSIISDQTSLNMLKAASERTAQRTVEYNSTRMDKTQVVFEGKIIIATNKDMSKNPHYHAVVDRFHVFDLRVSYKEKLAKIYEIATMNKTDEERAVSDSIISFLFDKETEVDHDKITIRTFVKLEELTRLMPTRWKRYAELSGTYLPIAAKEPSR